MRIACLHLPAFPLQVALRGAPRAPGALLAVVAARAGAMPVVTACSRAARAAGVQVGMAAATARELVPELELVPADAAAERAAVHAIAEALLGVAPRVDAGGAPAGAHHALYCEVPAKMRGAAFGARALAVLEVMGVTGRVGIADDRFTAYVAASWPALDDDHDGVVSVPRGGSAAFLAPLPLSLLSVGGEVQHVLEALGVHTLGAFAALPPPDVARAAEIDWHALARGDGGAALTAFAPAGPLVERVALGDGAGLGAAVGALAARIAARLGGRGQQAAAIELGVGGLAAPSVVGAAGATGPVAGAGRTFPIVPAAPLATAEELADAIGAAVSSAAAGASPLWLEARVTRAIGDGAVAAPALADGSAPIAAPVAAAASFHLTPPSVTSAVPRAPHRRTRRGKERPRALAVSAQPGLFATRDR